MRTREEQAKDMAIAIEGTEFPNGNLVRLMAKELAEAEHRAEQRVRAEIERAGNAV